MAKKPRKSGRKKARKGGKKKSRKGGKKRKARKGGKRKAKRKGSKLTKRQRAGRKAARTRAMKKAKRSAAAKKAARCRKNKSKCKSKKRRRKGGKRKAKRGGKRRGKKRGGKRRGKKRGKGRRRTPKMGTRGYEKHLAARVRAKQRKDAKKDREVARLEKKIARLKAAEEARGRRRHHTKKVKHRARAAAPNPIGSSDNMEFLTGFAGAVFGGLGALALDRWASTHPLAVGSSGSGFADTPASGQVYDSQGPNTPWWSSMSRVLWGIVGVAAPLGISAIIPDRHPHWKSFFQVAFFGSLTVTGTKIAADGASKLLGSTSMGARLFAPEAAASAQLAAGSALPSVDLTTTTGKQVTGSGSVMVAGPPKRQMGAPNPGFNPNLPVSASNYPTTDFPQAPSSSLPPAGPCPPCPPTANQGGSNLGVPPFVPGTGLPPQPPLPYGPVCMSCASSTCAGARGGSCSDEFDMYNPSGETPSDSTTVEQ